MLLLEYYYYFILLLLSHIIVKIIFRNYLINNFYRCAGKSGEIFSPILLFCLITITLIVMLFCYVNILRELNRVNRELRNNDKKSKKQKRAFRKIVSYVIVFVVHWIPVLIQNLGRLLGVRFFFLFLFIYLFLFNNIYIYFLWIIRLNNLGFIL